MKRLFMKIFGRPPQIIRRALSCKGWTDESKLYVLSNLVRETERLDGDILEIGSAWGRSTVLLGLASHKTIWSIDPHTGGLAYIQKGDQQNSYDEFMQNLNTFDLHGKVKVLRNTTQEVMSQNLMSPDARFSLVFIDGLHTPEGVKIDIDFAYERLVSGGVMVFDDYFELSVKDYAAMIDTMLAEKKVNTIRDRDSKLVYFYKSGN